MFACSVLSVCLRHDKYVSGHVAQRLLVRHCRVEVVG